MMAVYTKEIGPNGNTAYRKDKRFVAKSNIPAAVFEALRVRNEVDDVEVNSGAKYRECIFCDEHSKNQRMVNGLTVYLCNDHYYDKNIGQVAEQLRKLRQA